MELRKYWIFRPKIKGLGNCHLSVSFFFFFFFFLKILGGLLLQLKKKKRLKLKNRSFDRNFFIY